MSSRGGSHSSGDLVESDSAQARQNAWSNVGYSGTGNTLAQAGPFTSQQDDAGHGTRLGSGDYSETGADGSSTSGAYRYTGWTDRGGDGSAEGSLQQEPQSRLLRRGTRQGTGHDDGYGELIDEGSYIRPTRTGTYRTLDSSSRFGDGDESGVTFADNPSYGRDESGQRGAGNRELNLSARAEAYNYDEPDGSIGQVSLTDYAEHATSGREDGTFRTVADALRSRDRDYRSGDGRSGTHHGTDRGSRDSHGTDPVTGERTTSLTETWDTTLDTLSSNGLGSQGNRADGPEDRYRNAGNSGQNLGHGSTLVTVTTARFVSDHARGSDDLYLERFSRDEKRTVAGDADDGSGTYNDRNDADGVRRLGQTEHRGTGQGAVVYHRRDASERQDYVNSEDSRNYWHSRSGYTSIEDRTGDAPGGGDGQDSDLAGTQNHHTESGWGELHDHGSLEEFSWQHSWGGEVFWGGPDSTRTWETQQQFEQHTPLDVDSRRDVSESWTGGLQNNYARSGDQHFAGTRSGPWQLHRESWEEIVAPNYFGDPNTDHVSSYTVDQIIVGQVLSSADEWATLTQDGFVIDGRSNGDRLVRTDEWTQRDWRSGTVHTPPTTQPYFVGQLTNFQVQHQTYRRTDLDYDRPTYDQAGPTAGSSTHEVHESSVHSGGGVITGLESGYGIKPTVNGGVLYLIRDPYTDVDVTDFAIRTYDYVEQGSFVPGDKRLAYYSGSLNTAGTYGYKQYDKAHRKYDSVAPHPGFDAHFGSTHSNTGTGGYSEVGYYPQWSQSAQQQAEQEAEGDPPLLHSHRTYFDSRPPEDGDEQLLVPAFPLPPVDGGQRSLGHALAALEVVADEEAVVKAFEDSIFDGVRNITQAVWDLVAVPADLTLGLVEAGLHVVGLGSYKPLPNFSSSAEAVDTAYGEGVPYDEMAVEGVLQVIVTVPSFGILPTLEGVDNYLETGDPTQWRHAATSQLQFALGASQALATPRAAPRLTSGANLAPEYSTVPGAPAAGARVHGNSLASPRTAYLYRLGDVEGNFLKWGVTQDMAKRYPKSFMLGKRMEEVAQGTRANMIRLERNLVETQPGPLNREPWAGRRLGGQP